VTLKGLPTLDINIKALSVQLYNMSLFKTLIEFFRNSLNGEEKINFLMPKELTLGTLAKRVAHLKRVCKIKDKFLIKFRRRKIQIKLNGLKSNLENWVFTTYKWQ